MRPPSPEFWCTKTEARFSVWQFNGATLGLPQPRILSFFRESSTIAGHDRNVHSLVIAPCHLVTTAHSAVFYDLIFSSFSGAQGSFLALSSGNRVWLAELRDPHGLWMMLPGSPAYLSLCVCVAGCGHSGVLLVVGMAVLCGFCFQFFWAYVRLCGNSLFKSYLDLISHQQVLQQS